MVSPTYQLRACLSRKLKFSNMNTKAGCPCSSRHMDLEKPRPTEIRAKTSLNDMPLPYPASLFVILFCVSHASFPPPASCSASRRDFLVEDVPVPPFSTILGNESEMETGATCCKKRKQVFFLTKRVCDPKCGPQTNTPFWSQVCIFFENKSG